MGDKVFSFSLRVPYAHIDKMGFVYYANYLIYFEMARSALLREAGLPYAALEARGVMLPVVEAHCQYRRAARFDDLIVVLSRCVSIKGPRLRIEYEIRRQEAGDQGKEIRGHASEVKGQAALELLVTGYTEHVCLSSDGKIMKPVQEIKDLVSCSEK